MSHQSGVLTAFLQRSKKMQIAKVHAVKSPAKPCGGVCFEHVQNKSRGLTFAQRVRQRAVATLWGLLLRRGRVVGAPPAR